MAKQVSAQKLPSHAEISYEIKGLPFDQMKYLQRRTERKNTKMRSFPQSIRNLISST